MTDQPGRGEQAGLTQRPLSPERPATVVPARDVGPGPADPGPGAAREPAAASEAGEPRSEPATSPAAAAALVAVEAAAPGADPMTPAPSGESADIDRRRFFRQFATDVFHTAATVVGAVGALQRSSAEAASAILNPSTAADAMTPPAAVPATPAPVAPLGPIARPRSVPAAGYRTPYRREDERLVLIDQRRLPDALVEIECRTAIDVANEIRDRSIVGAPAIAQAAALGLAMSADRVRRSRPYARRAILRAAATTLISSRPTARPLAEAVRRVMARYEAIGELDEDGDRIAGAMIHEAETVVYEASEDHGRLAEFAAAWLPRPADRPLAVVTLGSTGTMGGGQFGTALGAVLAATYQGREAHVFVLEGRPWLDGARILAWELAQAGLPYTILADSGAGSLLGSGRVDAVVVGAEAVAANGDLANDPGTYALAVLADRHAIPFLVCAPLAAVDLGAADGAALPTEDRPAAEVTSFGGVSVAPHDSAALNPVVDITPVSLISAFATEEGVLARPSQTNIAAAIGSRERRRPASTAGAVAVPERAVAVPERAVAVPERASPAGPA